MTLLNEEEQTPTRAPSQEPSTAPNTVDPSRDSNTKSDSPHDSTLEGTRPDTHFPHVNDGNGLTQNTNSDKPQQQPPAQPPSSDYHRPPNTDIQAVERPTALGNNTPISHADAEPHASPPQSTETRNKRRALLLETLTMFIASLRSQMSAVDDQEEFLVDLDEVPEYYLRQFKDGIALLETVKNMRLQKVTPMQRD